MLLKCYASKSILIAVSSVSKFSKILVFASTKKCFENSIKIYTIEEEKQKHAYIRGVARGGGGVLGCP